MNLSERRWTITLLGLSQFTVLISTSTFPLPRDFGKLIIVFDSRVSDMFNKAFNSVATHNSSEAGGTLPKEMKLARLDYARETTLTTLFWLWK